MSALNHTMMYSSFAHASNSSPAPLAILLSRPPRASLQHTLVQTTRCPVSAPDLAVSIGSTKRAATATSFSQRSAREGAGPRFVVRPIVGTAQLVESLHAWLRASIARMTQVFEPRWIRTQAGRVAARRGRVADERGEARRLGGFEGSRPCCPRRTRQDEFK